MQSKRLYLLVLLLLYIGINQNSIAQIQINSNNLSLCNNNSGFLFVVNNQSVNASFQWQDSSAFGWTNITNTSNFIGVNNDTLFIFNANNSINGIKVRCIIDSASVAIRKDTTQPASIVVFNTITAPKITKSQTICYLSNTDTIKALQAAGGADGNFIYQWQLSGNSTTFTDIPGADSLSLFLTSLTDSIYYIRLSAVSLFGCGIAFSDTITVRVLKPFIKPIIGSNQTICYNSIPQKIALIPNQNSVDGLFDYQWQASTDSINFYDLINQKDSELVFTQKYTQSFFYRLKVTSKSGCGNKFSDTVLIKVLSNIIKPQISSSQNVCFNSQPDTLKMIQKAKGANQSFTYQWQESNNGVTWQFINSASDTFLSLSGLINTKYFRIAAFNNCDTVFSDSVKILIYDKLNPGVIKSNQNICYNTSPQVLSFLTLPSGANGNYTYRWQVSTDSLNFSDINNASSSIYQPSVLTSTKYYRLKVISNCGTDFSNIIKINVYAELTSPIINTLIDTICFGNVSDSIFISDFPTGANGIYNFQWEYSLDSVNWFNISAANAYKYSSGRLFQTTYYRVLVATNCGLKYSNVKKVFVFSKINKPVLSVNQIICYNTIPDTVRVVVPAFGADNRFVYSWYQSSDAKNWVIIPNVNLLKYNPGKLTKSVYYKVIAQNYKSCSVSSDSMYIQVYDEFKSGIISNSQTVCYFNEIDTLRFSQMPSGAGDSFTYQWQVSTDSVNFTNIISSTSTSYKAPATDHTKFYRVKVNSTNGCGILYTNIIKIKVYDKFIGAIISGNDTICKDSIPNRFTLLQLPKGGNLQYFYQWQQSTDLATWSNILNATFSNYQAPKLYTTTYYRLINYSGMNCGFDTSNVIMILVQDLPDTTEIVGYTEVCKNQQELFYKLYKTNEDYKYRWFVNKAEILTNDQANAIFLNWGELTGNDTIRVLQFNKVTGCYNYMLLPIIIKEDRAPDKTKIIRKSSTNILVCEDSSANLNYQWGYIEKGTTIMQDIPNANLRYVLLPHSFDTNKYVYYVRTIFNGCVTNTFYNYFDPLIFNSVKTEKLKIAIYPNPNNGNFKISGLPNYDYKLYVYDLLGRSVAFEQYHDEIMLTNSGEGIYFVVVHYKNSIYNQRIIVK